MKIKKTKKINTNSIDILNYKEMQLSFEAIDRLEAIVIFNNKLYSGYTHIDALLDAFDDNNIPYNGWEETEEELEEKYLYTDDWKKEHIYDTGNYNP